jgi:hydroxyacylglutathione hydrolase
MQSTRWIRLTIFLFSLILFSLSPVSMVARAAPASAEDSAPPLQSGPETKTMSENSEVIVHPINMIASNAYLLETPEGLILVDAGIPFSERQVYRKMREIGRDDLKLIYITHAHIDHYGAANAIREKTGAPIAIHKDDAAPMALGRTELGTVRDWKRLSNATLPYIEPLLRVTPTEADILLEDGDSLQEYGIDAYVMHTPGHTPGSSTLIVNDTMAFAGDLVASGRKVHAQRSYAQDWQEVARSLIRLAEAGPEIIYAGHGSEPITLEQLRNIDPNYVEP